MIRRLIFPASLAAVLVITAQVPVQAQARQGITLTVAVTGGTGAPVPDARVILTGPVSRDGETIPNGTIRFTGLRPGSYRLRVEHAGYITLEREITLRATQKTPVEMTLTEAPPPPAPPEPEPPPPSPSETAPPGEPRSIQVTDFLEKNFITGKVPFKQDELGCTASARTTLLQILESTPEAVNANADEVLFAIAGEGTLRLGNRDVTFSSRQGSIGVVPRGTARALSKKGRNPLIVLSVVSGPSCTGAAAPAP